MAYVRMAFSKEKVKKRNDTTTKKWKNGMENEISAVCSFGLPLKVFFVYV